MTMNQQPSSQKFFAGDCYSFFRQNQVQIAGLLLDYFLENEAQV